MASSTFFSDWNQMLKPRVTSLVLATIIPGLYLASEQSPSGFFNRDYFVWNIFNVFRFVYIQSGDRKG